MFPRLDPARAPAGWRHRALPDGTAVLAYPPGMHPITGDSVAVSVARLGRRGLGWTVLVAIPARPRRQSSGSNSAAALTR